MGSIGLLDIVLGQAKMSNLIPNMSDQSVVAIQLHQAVLLINNDGSPRRRLTTGYNRSLLRLIAIDPARKPPSAPRPRDSQFVQDLERVEESGRQRRQSGAPHPTLGSPRGRTGRWEVAQGSRTSCGTSLQPWFDSQNNVNDAARLDNHFDGRLGETMCSRKASMRSSVVYLVVEMLPCEKEEGHAGWHCFQRHLSGLSLRHQPKPPSGMCDYNVVLGKRHTTDYSHNPLPSSPLTKHFKLKIRAFRACVETV